MSVTLIEGANKLDVGLTPIPPPVAGLYGVVTDSDTGYAIYKVLVEVVGTGLSSYTDPSGNYEIADIPLGTYDIRFSHVDYETLVI